MTVAVSVASGVDNIISALPMLNPFRVEIAVGFIVILAAVNLRGVRESSKAFAVPTYLFIGSIAVMIVVVLVRTALGDAPVAESADYRGAGREPDARPRSCCCCCAPSRADAPPSPASRRSPTACPAFRRPKIQNAQKTLVAMGGIAIVLFSGLVVVALIAGVHYAEDACHLDRLRRLRDRRPAAQPDRPDRLGDVRQQLDPVLRHPGGDRGGAAARRQHRVQRVPAARLGARHRPLRARSRWRPAATG